MFSYFSFFFSLLLSFSSPFHSFLHFSSIFLLFYFLHLSFPFLRFCFFFSPHGWVLDSQTHLDPAFSQEQDGMAKMPPIPPGCRTLIVIMAIYMGYSALIEGMKFGRTRKRRARRFGEQTAYHTYMVSYNF